MKLTYLPLILGLSACFFQHQLAAQQDAQFSQYMFNNLYLNPATAGNNPKFSEATFIHRTQWAGYNATFDDGGAPTSQILSFSLPLTKYRSGLGMHIVNDQVGAMRNLELQLSLAHHIKIKRYTLSIGVRGGLYNQSQDFNKLRFVDENDPLKSSGKQSEFTKDFAAGMYLTNGKLLTGVSLNHLVESEFKYGSQLTYASLTRHANFMLGYNFTLSNGVILTPTAIVKTDFNSTSFETSVLATFSQRYHAGLSYRDSDAVILLLGAYLGRTQKLRLGYAFDLTVNGTNAKETTSHELMLAYRMPAIKFFEPKIIRTPRFRH